MGGLRVQGGSDQLCQESDAVGDVKGLHNLYTLSFGFYDEMLVEFGRDFLFFSVLFFSFRWVFDEWPLLSETVTCAG